MSNEISTTLTDIPGEAEKKRRLVFITIGVFIFGTIFRYIWLFHIHRATAFVYSDMKMYLDTALRWVDPDYQTSVLDTLFPPGTSLWLAGTFLIFPSLEAVMIQNFLMSITVPLIIGVIGRTLFGWRLGLWAVIIISLYFPFIDLAGFFLSENPFIFLLYLGFLLTLKSVSFPSSKWAFLAAWISGALMGCAVHFKGQAVLPFLFTVFLILGSGLRWSWPQLRSVFVGLVLGGLLVVIPVTTWLTRMNEGRLCFISNNGPMNILFGHDPNVGSLKFQDPVRGHCHVFLPPPFFAEGRTKVETLPFGAYESDKILRVVWQRIMANKLAALRLSFAQVWELFFGTPPWPMSETKFRSAIIVFQMGFLLLMVVPACLHCLSHWRFLRCGDLAFLPDLLLLMPIGGLITTVFLTFGEMRYRLPYDGFIILLALRWYLPKAKPVWPCL